MKMISVIGLCCFVALGAVVPDGKVAAQQPLAGDEAVLVRELAASRDKIRSFYRNCIFRSKSYLKTGDEIRNEKRMTFASRGSCRRLDVVTKDGSSSGDHSRIKCIQQSGDAFFAHKTRDEFVIDQKNVSSQLANEEMGAEFMLATTAYSTLNVDLVEVCYQNPDIRFRNIDRKTEGGDEVWSFEYTKPDWGVFSRATYRLYQGADVWVLTELNFGNGIQTNSFVGVVEGIPQIKQVQYAFFDGSPSDTAYVEVRELIEFERSAPPKKYFTMAGIDVDLHDSISPWWWFVPLVIGVVVVLYFGTRKQNDTRNSERVNGGSRPESNQLRYGFTLIELITTMAILGALFAIMLPAVQVVRESSRRIKCQNNLRQIALATANFESSNSHLPFSSLNGIPSEGTYSSDTSWLVSTMPFLEQESLVESLVPSNTLFDISHRAFFEKSVPVLQCPSGEGEGYLGDVAQRFSGKGVTNLNAVTGDYRGCSGFLEHSKAPKFDGRQKLGPLSLRIVPGRAIRGTVVSDGRSNTILLWESLGRQWYSRSFGRIVERPWERVFKSGTLLAVAGPEDKGPFIDIETEATKSYLFSWAGFANSRVGAWDQNGLTSGSFINEPETYNSVVNVTNKFGQPFSFHPGICNVAMMDGSVRSFEKSVSPQVFFAASSMADGVISEAISPGR